MAGPLQPLALPSQVHRAPLTMDKVKAAAKPHVHRRRASPAKSIDSAVVFHKPAVPPRRARTGVASSSNAPTSSSGPTPLPPRRPSTQTQKIELPKQLPIPRIPEVDPTAIEVVDPSLAGVPAKYVIDRLQDMRDIHLKGMASIVRDALCVPPSGLPTVIQLVVHDVAATLPTHVVAVIDAKTNRGLLFPFHALILAAHCANLPNLPPSAPLPTYNPNNSITIAVPVVPLTLPHTASFGLLHEYLYTKRYDRLISALLPLPYDALPPIDACPDKTRQNLSEALAKEHTLKELVDLTRQMHGLWSNTCKLGISDEGLWALMHTAWDLLIGAIAVAST